MVGNMGLQNLTGCEKQSILVVKNMSSRQTAWVQVPALTLISCMTLGRLLSCLEPQFVHL